jgi:hypothetical protein
LKIETPVHVPEYPQEVPHFVEIPDFEKVPTPIHIPFPKPFIPDEPENKDDESFEETISKLIANNFKIVVGSITMCLVIIMMMCCCCCRSNRVLEEEAEDEH